MLIQLPFLFVLVRIQDFRFFIFSIGTPNIWDALASYILPCVLNTSSLHCSPASQLITLASIAEKSATTNSNPIGGYKCRPNQLRKSFWNTSDKLVVLILNFDF